MVGRLFVSLLLTEISIRSMLLVQSSSWFSRVFKMEAEKKSMEREDQDEGELT